MPNISSRLSGFTLIKHKRTGDIYAVNKTIWRKFLKDYNPTNSSKNSTIPEAFKLRVNFLGEYDFSESSQPVDYSHFKGLLIEIVTTIHAS